MTGLFNNINNTQAAEPSFLSENELYQADLANHRLQLDKGSLSDPHVIILAERIGPCVTHVNNLANRGYALLPPVHTFESQHLVEVATETQLRLAKKLWAGVRVLPDGKTYFSPEQAKELRAAFDTMRKTVATLPDVISPVNENWVDEGSKHPYYYSTQVDWAPNSVPKLANGPMFDFLGGANLTAKAMQQKPDAGAAGTIVKAKLFNQITQTQQEFDDFMAWQKQTLDAAKSYAARKSPFDTNRDLKLDSPNELDALLAAAKANPFIEPDKLDFNRDNKTDTNDVAHVLLRGLPQETVNALQALGAKNQHVRDMFAELVKDSQPVDKTALLDAPQTPADASKPVSDKNR